jgi:hypothetical protein
MSKPVLTETDTNKFFQTYYKNLNADPLLPFPKLAHDTVYNHFKPTHKVDERQIRSYVGVSFLMIAGVFLLMACIPLTSPYENQTTMFDAMIKGLGIGGILSATMFIVVSLNFLYLILFKHFTSAIDFRSVEENNIDFFRDAFNTWYLNRYDDTTPLTHKNAKHLLENRCFITSKNGNDVVLVQEETQQGIIVRTATPFEESLIAPELANRNKDTVELPFTEKIKNSKTEDNVEYIDASEGK